MDSRTIVVTIHHILVNELKRDIERSLLRLEQEFMGDLGLDSVAMITLQVSVEDTFGLYFDPVEHDLAEIFRSVDSLVSFIKKDLDQNVASDNLVDDIQTGE